MDAAPKPVAKKAPEVRALHCLNPDCGGLLAYEVDRQNVLSVDLAWTARRDGATRYFPCPKCGGKNILEEITLPNGRRAHKVARWQP